MLDWVVNTSLRSRLLVLVFVAGLAGAGYWSYREVPMDSFPDVTPTLVQVFTVSPGLSPVDVEKQISYPIEIAMYGLPKLDRVQSTSVFGLSRVNIYFEDGTDYFYARRLVLERLQQARNKIPPGLGNPKIGPMASGLGRIAFYTIENKKGANHSLMERRTAQDWIAKPMLRTTPNVTGVLSVGGHVRQFQVRLDMNALLARDLTIGDVRKALLENNRTVGGSFLQTAGEERIVRGYGWIRPGKKGLEDIRNIIVKETDGTPIYVDDVAKVTFGSKIRRGALVASGPNAKKAKETVGGFILKLINTNTQKVLHSIKEKAKQINKALPDGMKLNFYYDQGSLVDKAVGTVEDALIEGAVLVLIFLYMFLGNVRSTLVVIGVLPLAALGAFIGMKVMGMSANLMSLGGLAIGIGMMVDGAVVVVENIFRHLEERKDEDVSMIRLVGEATRQVARPTAFSIGIIIIVFLPLFTLQGVEGRMFSPMAYTISFALVAALILALTFVPVLCSLLFTRRTAHGDPRIVRWLKAGYRPVVRGVIRVPSLVLGTAVALLVGSLLLFPYLGTEFVPTLREGTFFIRSVLPSGANLDTSIRYAKRIQRSLAEEFPQKVQGMYARVGRAEVGGDPEPVNVVATLINLKDLTKWKSGRTYEELQSAMAKQLEKDVPGLANNMSQPIQMRTDELLSGVRAQVAVSIYGSDLNQLADVGQQIVSICREVEGAVDVRMLQQGGKPQLLVRPNRKELARLGISIDKFLKTVETGIGGSTAGQVFEGIRRFDVFVRLQKDQRAKKAQIEKLPLRTKDGSIVPLSQVASVKLFDGPKTISRNKGSRRTYVQFNVRGRDMGSVVREIQKKVAAQVDMPPGYYVEYGGQFKNQRRAMQRLYIVVPITLGLIFLLLFMAFGKLRYATLIFMNVPFAVIGGIVALYVSGLYLSVPAAVGFIAVFGVAVLNGNVLVAYINQLRQAGYATEEAVQTGAEHRLRPVLMTASVATLGLIPLLLADDIGSNVQRPLAAVVVGGLVTSTLLTLVVLPSIYRWFAAPVEEVET